MRRELWVLYVLISGTIVPASAQQGESRAARIVGMVVDSSGRAVRNAGVVLDGHSSVETNAGGQFRFDSLAPGTHRIAVRAIGYTPFMATVRLAAGTADARITLSSSPYRLPELSVRARRPHLDEVGFYRRRAEERGIFLDGDSLMRLDSLNVVFGLSRLRGFHEKAVGAADPDVVSMVCRNGFRLWLNGWEIDGADRAFYLRTLTPAEVEGVEIYESGTPPLVFMGHLPQECQLAIWER